MKNHGLESHLSILVSSEDKSPNLHDPHKITEELETGGLLQLLTANLTLEVSERLS